MKLFWKILSGALAISVAWLFSSLPSFAALQSRSGDALHTRVRNELKVFTDWLTTNNVNGYIGEVGWPNNIVADQDSWNTLAETWYKDADVANLWVTDWSTVAEWGNYGLAPYTGAGFGTSVNTIQPQSIVLEKHLSTSNYHRGVNVSGGEFGTHTDGTFSNHSPGVYGTDYLYDPQGTFTYLASRGVDIVRIPFRWERIQPTLNSALDTNELTRLQNVVTEAGNAGLKIILDLHNFGTYWLYNGSTGVQTPIGNPSLPVSSFTDVWTRLSSTFKNNSNVLAYDLMNEPTNLQATMSAYTTLYNWDSSTQSWGSDNGSTLTASSAQVYSGSGSLAVSKTLGSGFVNMRINDTKSNLRDISANGLTLSAWVYLPVGTPGTNWQAHIEVQNSSF